MFREKRSELLQNEQTPKSEVTHTNLLRFTLHKTVRPKLMLLNVAEDVN